MAEEVTAHLTYVTLDHKSSHKRPFFKIEIYTSYESFSLMYGLLW